VSYVAIIYNIGAIVGGIFMGSYSDRVGRRRSMITALLLAIVFIPVWAFAPTIPLLIIGAFLLQFMVQGAWGVIPAHINELAPDSVRGFLPGFAYQCGVAVAGTAATIQEALAEYFPRANVMAGTALTVFALAAVVVWLGREKHAAEFGVVAASDRVRVN
jgi:SHS family lactate transporter-like MFS transporter